MSDVIGSSHLCSQFATPNDPLSGGVGPCCDVCRRTVLQSSLGTHSQVGLPDRTSEEAASPSISPTLALETPLLRRWPMTTRSTALGTDIGRPVQGLCASRAV